MKAKEYSDEEIILKIKEGNKNMFGVLMHRYNQRLHRIAFSFGIQDMETEDLIQQSYISAFEKLHQFEGKSKFSTWLTRILINECLMYKRRMKKNEQVFMRSDSLTYQSNTLSSGETPASLLEKKELIRLLEIKINNMPEKYRTVYLMRQVEEMSIREIAECLNISEINAKVRVYRAKSFLKEFQKTGINEKEILTFGNERCDRIVENVLNYIKNKSNNKQLN